jgi:hypothetical protein
MKRIVYGLLLIMTILFTVAALSTLIPAANASKTCMLGYRAHCTFTPISTIICIILAGSVCSIRKRFFKDET